jgi:epoxide hydrolase-like predicted phosphatase
MTGVKADEISVLRGLLVDYGGVLTNPLTPVLQDFCRSKGIDQDAITALTVGNGPRQTQFHRYERGEISAEIFLPLFAEWLGIDRDEIHSMLDGLEPDSEMFRAVSEARRRGIRTCLLSNSWGTALYPRDLLAEAFDEVVISEEVGMRKPELGIFVLAAQRLDLEPRECVFIDDTLSHLDGARQLGITAIHHVDVANTVRVMGELVGLRLG